MAPQTLYEVHCKPVSECFCLCEPQPGLWIPLGPVQGALPVGQASGPSLRWSLTSLFFWICTCLCDSRSSYSWVSLTLSPTSEHRSRHLSGEVGCRRWWEGHCTGCKFSMSKAVGLGLHEKSYCGCTSNIPDILKKRKAAVELAEAEELCKRLRVDEGIVKAEQVHFGAHIMKI